jgi:hypothetical protein
MMNKEKLRKSPGKSPLPPLPPHEDVNHPPPAEMKYAEEAGALVSNSAARWHARKYILANYIQCISEKEECRKRMNYSSTSQEDTPTHIHAKSPKKTLKIHRYLSNPTKKKLHQHELQQERPNDRKPTL